MLRAFTGLSNATRAWLAPDGPLLALGEEGMAGIHGWFCPLRAPCSPRPISSCPIFRRRPTRHTYRVHAPALRDTGGAALAPWPPSQYPSPSLSLSLYVPLPSLLNFLKPSRPIAIVRVRLATTRACKCEAIPQRGGRITASCLASV